MKVLGYVHVTDRSNAKEGPFEFLGGDFVGEVAD